MQNLNRAFSAFSANSPGEWRTPDSRFRRRIYQLRESRAESIWHFRSRRRSFFPIRRASRSIKRTRNAMDELARCFVLIGFMRFTCTARWISACTRGALGALHIPFHSVSRYPICTRAARSTENSIFRGLLIVDEFKRESYGLWWE